MSQSPSLGQAVPILSASAGHSYFQAQAGHGFPGGPLALRIQNSDSGLQGCPAVSPSACSLRDESISPAGNCESLFAAPSPPTHNLDSSAVPRLHSRSHLVLATSPEDDLVQALAPDCVTCVLPLATQGTSVSPAEPAAKAGTGSPRPPGPESALDRLCPHCPSSHRPAPWQRSPLQTH